MLLQHGDLARKTTSVTKYLYIERFWNYLLNFYRLLLDGADISRCLPDGPEEQMPQHPAYYSVQLALQLVVVAVMVGIVLSRGWWCRWCWYCSAGGAGSAGCGNGVGGVDGVWVLYVQ